MSRRPWAARVTACLVVLFGAGSVWAREIHVAKTGDDAGAGDRARPYLTISKAAAVAQPGDTVTVHAGTYREWVKPARGGTSETARMSLRFRLSASAKRSSDCAHERRSAGFHEFASSNSGGGTVA